MRSKKGMSTISIVCFLGMIAIVSLSILVLEINKYELIKIGSQENIILAKAEEDVISILHSFKEKVENTSRGDDENIENLINNENNSDNLNLDKEVELSNEKVSIEQAIKVKFENKKGIVRHKNEEPYIEVQLKNIKVADIEFFYYNYRIDDSGITFIEY